MMSFAKVPESNYRFFVTAMQNKKPERMPLYEHHIDAGFIQKDIHEPMVELLDGPVEAKRKFFRLYVDYWQNHGYDIVTFERGIPLACPGSGALRFNGEPCIKTPEDLARYPWDEIPDRYFAQEAEYFELFAEEVLKRDNIRAAGGPGMEKPETIARKVRETIEENIDFGGFALGCGNSIPDYIPVEGFLAMNQTANEFRLQQMR